VVSSHLYITSSNTMTHKHSQSMTKKWKDFWLLPKSLFQEDNLLICLLQLQTTIFSYVKEERWADSEKPLFQSLLHLLKKIHYSLRRCHLLVNNFQKDSLWYQVHSTQTNLWISFSILDTSVFPALKTCWFFLRKPK